MHNIIKSIMTDVVSIRKQNGDIIKFLPAKINKNTIYIDNLHIKFNVNDEILYVKNKNIKTYIIDKISLLVSKNSTCYEVYVRKKEENKKEIINRLNIFNNATKKMKNIIHK